MIASRQTQTSVKCVVLQNGRKIFETNNKAATGEEALQGIVITTRKQYGLPDDSVVYCNFNQLYKIDPLTLQMWVHVSVFLSISCVIFCMRPESKHLYKKGHVLSCSSAVDLYWCGTT